MPPRFVDTSGLFDSPFLFWTSGVLQFDPPFEDSGDLIGQASAAEDWIVAAVIRPENIGAYHNVIDDDAQIGPMLWIDSAFNYELNFSRGTGARAAGTGPDGWDIVIADSRLNELYVNSPTPNATGGAPVGREIRGIGEALTSGEAVDYARALHRSRLEIRNRPEWSSPYCWAPFIQTGLR